MSITLRDYQQRAVDSVFEQWKEHDSTVVILPTGGGKTICFAQVAQLVQPGKVLVLAHREELIWQAKDKIERTTGLHCAVEMGNWCIDPSQVEIGGEADVVISTIQTQIAGGKNPRMHKFDPMRFAAVIIDEMHHAASASYRKVIDYYRRNPELRLLGVTATPDRSDELALGEIFQSVAFDYEILDAIHDGYLVPIDQQFVHVHDLDFSKVRTTAGDLNGADLAALMEQERNMHEVASATLEIIGNRRTIIFTASVKQAETISSILNRHKPGMAGWACGETDKIERKQLGEDFASGAIQVVANCGIWTEGYDNPYIECVVMAKPTKSRSLFSQMVGRGTRSLPGVIDGLGTADERKAAIAASAKPSVLVLDFCGNSGKHKLMSTADILGGKSSEEAIELAKEKAKKAGKQVSMSSVLDEAASEIAAKREEARLAEEARKAKLVAQARYSMNSVDPFEKFGVKFQAPNNWDKNSGRMLSPAQRDVIKKAGADPDKISIACGKQLINEIFNRPSDGQAKVLTRYGYPLTCTRKEASKIIDAIANNGWKRPDPTPTPA